MKSKRSFKLSGWQLLAVGYLTVILCGSALLSLPSATADGTTTYINALFVSTSATCVTGLVPYDTGTHWTFFGQIVILALIQTGGLGFMTFVSLAVSMFGKKMGLYGRKVLMLSAGGSDLASLRHMIKRIFLGTFLFEGIGAILLSIRFIPTFGTLYGLYFAIFHSVSAFCNAGFDILGAEYGEFASLTYYAKDPLVVLTIAFLIIIGGLGFCVWSDIWDTKFRWKKFRLHTKMVLSVTASLLVVSTLLFVVFERNNVETADFTFGEKVLVAFFNATTTRTAGFNTVDMSGLSDSGYLLAVMLMFIGGSSASTAGGVKTNTMAVIVMGMFAAFRGKKDIEAGKRRIDHALLGQALAIFVSCLFLVIVATLAICAIEMDSVAPFKAVLFETVSALGTVGLSMSLTTKLGSISKLILILLMYAGRVGILTLALAFGENRSVSNIRKPLDDTILVG